MVRSMTAFARVEQSGDQGDITWELRSVNHRFLDLSFRLPEDFRALEGELRERLGKRLKRGKVDISLRYRAAEGQEAPALDETQLQSLLGLVEQVDAHLRPPAPINAMELLRWPGVVRQPEIALETLFPACLQAFDQASEEMVAARQREGEALRGLLLERCDGIAGLADQARERLPEIRERLRERFRERIAEAAVECDPGRLEQEIAIQAQKMDVDEELDRLGAHIAEIRQVLDRDEPVGRRLDFLIQELHREANTLGSKSLDIATTQISVELKVLIEQMREQVQNLE